MDLRHLVSACLTDLDRWEARRLGHREWLREKGRRLVQQQHEGGRLVVRDAITGEVLFRGSVADGLRLLDSDPALADIDTVDQEVPVSSTPVEGVPEELVDAVRSWVETNVDDAREWVREGAADGRSA